MANKKVDLGCNQLRGTFQISGKVNGRLSQNFYTEGVSQSGKAWRKVHFGVEIEPNKSVYLDLFGAVQDQCYISKRITVGGKVQSETTPISWADRFKFEKDPKYKGFSMIGITCGCEKIIDSKGIEKNKVMHLIAFDACDEVQNLHDGDSVFVKGNIVYSTYNNQHRVNFEPTQISLCREIDFDDIEFKPNALFTQPMVLMGVKGNNETNEYDVQAKIVNYQSIEDAEFHISKEYAALAKTLARKGEYVHIKAFGSIVVSGEVVKETEIGEWGIQSNRMDRVASPFTRKLMIEGVDPSSVDNESYSKEVIEKAEEIVAGIRKAKEDYGTNSLDDNGDDDDWGKGSKGKLDEDKLDDFDMDLGL